MKFRKEASERADPARRIELRKEADSGFPDKRLPADSGEFQTGARSGNSELADGGTQPKQASPQLGPSGGVSSNWLNLRQAVEAGAIDTAVEIDKHLRQAAEDATQMKWDLAKAADALMQHEPEVVYVHDHDHIFWFGDSNSRLHHPKALGGVPINDAIDKLEKRLIGELLALDQLNLMRRDSMAFESYEELEIKFLPSYKWRPNEDKLDIQSQKHVPAWTDRVLYRSQTRPACQAKRYDMHVGLKQSDHRPVFCTFSVPYQGRKTSKSPIASPSPKKSPDPPMPERAGVLANLASPLLP
jgi:hypothetical protein